MARSRFADGFWSVGAQILASASNFVVQFGLVVTMSAARFGALVVGFAVFHMALALARAWVGDPLVAMADSSHDVDRGWPEARRRLVALGLASTAVVAVWAAIADGVRGELALLALSIPFLLLQDGHRYRAWALGRFGRVAGIDAIWLGTFFLAVAAVGIGRSPSAIDGSVVIAAWVGGGIASWQAARVLDDRRLAALRQRDVPRAGRLPDDQPDAADRRAARGLAAQQAILAVDANGLPIAVAAAADATVTAGIRAVVLPFAPMTSVLTGVRVLTLPYLRRSVRQGHGRKAIVRVSVLFAVLAFAVGSVTATAMAIVPDQWLGESGRLVRAWFPVGAVVVSTRLIGLPLADLVSLGTNPGLAARIRIGTSGFDWSATLAGAALYGLEGAVVGRASAGAVSLLVWALMVVVGFRDLPANDTVRAPAGSPS